MFYVLLPIVALVLLLASYTTSKQIWNILDTPCVSPSGAIVGLCEISGKASTELDERQQLKPLMLSPMHGAECVWFHILLEKWVESDKSGHWETVQSKESRDGFRIVDGYGGVFVDPTNAKKFLTKTVNASESSEYIEKAKDFFDIDQADSGAEKAAQKWQASPDGYYMYHPNIGKYIPSTYVSENRQMYYDATSAKWENIYRSSVVEGFLSAIKKLNTQKLRVTETVVFPMQDIFAHGYISFPEENAVTNELRLGSKGKSHSDYYVSSQGEKGPLKSLKISRAVCVVGGVLASMLTVILFQTKFSDQNVFDDLQYGGNAFLRFFIPLLWLIGILFFGSIILKLGRTYNRFIKLKQQINVSSSTIDIVLKRRSTLIPQLKTVIDEAARHEASLQEAAAQMRSKGDEDFIQSVFALREAYPNLKTSENFMQLQMELGRSEEKIAMARSFLIDSTLNYNNLRATFTGIIFTPIFKKI